MWFGQSHREPNPVPVPGKAKSPEDPKQMQRKRTGPRALQTQITRTAGPGTRTQCPRQEGGKCPSSPLLFQIPRGRLPGEGERAGPKTPGAQVSLGYD